MGEGFALSLKSECMTICVSGKLRAHLADLVDQYRFRAEYSGAVGCFHHACMLLGASLEAALAAELAQAGVTIDSCATFPEVLREAQLAGLLPEKRDPYEALEPAALALPPAGIVLEGPSWIAKISPSEEACRALTQPPQQALQNCRGYVAAVLSHLLTLIARRGKGTSDFPTDRLGAVLIRYLEELCRNEEELVC